MIEIEIRGRLTKEKFLELKDFFNINGKHIESHDREMILLKDYVGYSKNLTERELDIRLRNTNGKCEIMIKRKSDSDNTSRKEISIELADATLDGAKELAKAFGCTKGVWMHRKKDIFEYKNIEWSLVEAPEEIFYFEAEILAGENDSVEEIRTHLIEAAEELGLKIFSATETDEFIGMLNEKVNKEISL
jgi:adenylate cyclase class IV